MALLFKRKDIQEKLKTSKIVEAIVSNDISIFKDGNIVSSLENNMILIKLYFDDGSISIVEIQE